VVPVFVKKGSVIPTMPVMQFIGQVENYPVIFEVFPAAAGKSATFDLYEDDGETNNYKLDICQWTTIKCVSSADSWVISVSKKALNGFESQQNRNLGIRIYLEKCPSSVIFNEVKAKKVNTQNIEDGWYEITDKIYWSWDETESACLIKFADSGIDESSTIKIISK
jgi:alpha-glucosidase